jgi:hypothetical protein
MNNLEFT